MSALLIGTAAYKTFCVFEMLRSSPISAWTQDPTADCAVVVTGGRGRIREGFDLLYRKQIRKLIVSGVHPQAQLQDLLPVWPYYGQLDETDVLLERRSRTTYGNAQQSLPLVEALQCRDVILVTSSLHMPRAFRTFRKVFPADVAIHPHAIVTTGHAVPGFSESMIETAKWLFYSVWAF